MASTGRYASEYSRRASGHHVDVLRRLEYIAASVLMTGRYPLYYIEVAELVNVGWIAHTEATTRARTASFPFAQARYAMLDYIRSSFGGRDGRIDRRHWQFEAERSAASHGLSEHEYNESYAIALASLTRLLTPRPADVSHDTSRKQSRARAVRQTQTAARLVETLRLLILDEIPAEAIAQRQGRSVMAVRVAKSLGLKLLRARMAA